MPKNKHIVEEVVDNTAHTAEALSNLAVALTNMNGLRSSSEPPTVDKRDVVVQAAKAMVSNYLTMQAYTDIQQIRYPGMKDLAIALDNLK